MDQPWLAAPGPAIELWSAADVAGWRLGDGIARARTAGFDDCWAEPIEFDRFPANFDARTGNAPVP